MLRNLLRPTSVVALPLALLVGCAGEKPIPQPPVTESPPLAVGTYQVQSVAYDDATGAYELFLLDPPGGASPKHVTTALRFVRLSDEEVAAGQKAKLAVDGEGMTAALPPDFQIAYAHNVVEERNGQPVVVRTESSMWSPFLTGMLVGQMMTPMYLYPPPYRPGAPLTGVGGMGATRSLAAEGYAQKHGTPPQSTRLAQSGYSKMPSASSLKASGSGAGSSRLSGEKAKPTSRPKARPFGGGFGRRR